MATCANVGQEFQADSLGASKCLIICGCLHNQFTLAREIISGLSRGGRKLALDNLKTIARARRGI